MSSRASKRRKQRREYRKSLIVELSPLREDPAYWADAEWDLFQSAVSALNLKPEDRAWVMDYIWNPQNWDGTEEANTEPEPRLIADITDEEWQSMSEAQFDALYYAWMRDENATTDIQIGQPKSGAKGPSKPSKCDCQGPGSPNQKWAWHTPQCPEYDGKGTFGSYKMCKHDRQVFALEDDLTIRASAHRDVKSVKQEDRGIGLGVYLYDGWMGKALTHGIVATPGFEFPFSVTNAYPSLFLDWPDMGPCSLAPSDMVDLSQWLLTEITAGKVVETGCMGGHGRTGTMLACLLTVQGVLPHEACDRVWDTYCKDAIESTKQTAYIVEVYESMHGDSWRTKENMAAWSEAMHAMFKPAAPPTGVTGFQYGGKAKESGPSKDLKPWYGAGTPGSGAMVYDFVPGKGYVLRQPSGKEVKLYGHP